MRFSIKVKWTLFITLLLMLTIIMTQYLMLRGVVESQKSYYEELLLEHSKTANLYVRECYVASGYNDFSLFYKEEAESLETELKRIIHLPISLYDKKGEILSDGVNLRLEKQPITIMQEAIKDQIIYVKHPKQIIYLAPLYDFEEQIGVFKIVYSLEKENLLYEKLRRLSLEIGFMGIVLTALIGNIYFSKIARRILKLKHSVEAIEEGIYEPMEVIKSKDEIGDLKNGIGFMANTIKQNMKELTEEKEKLSLTLQKLQKAKEEQKEFIGNVTHEFKTPLTVIKTQLDLISLYGDDAEMTQQAKQIADKEIKRMNSMIENILYLSRLERYKFEFKKEWVNVKEVLEEIVLRLEAGARKIDLTIIKEIEETYILIDKDSLVQILMNLIDNAIKYNKENGRIHIRSYLREGKNIIEIKNTGIRIPEEYKERIFEPFFTVDKNHSRQLSGTGLGLPLVKKLIEAQGGNIRLVQCDEENCFTITFQNISIK